MDKEVLSTEDFSNLIANHIERMCELERSSVKYFIETGKVNGSFRLRLIAMMKFCEWMVIDKLNKPMDKITTQDCYILSGNRSGDGSYEKELSFMLKDKFLEKKSNMVVLNLQELSDLLIDSGISIEGTKKVLRNAVNNNSIIK